MRSNEWRIPRKVNIAGIDILQLIEAATALAAAYVIARIVSRVLNRMFEKTPFPENAKEGIGKILRYAIYIVGTLIAVSLLGVDLTPLTLSMTKVRRF